MTATGETGGWNRTRIGTTVGLVVLALLFSGLAGWAGALPARAGPPGTPLGSLTSHPVRVAMTPHPFAGNPIISYFFFSPASLVETTGSTSIFSSVYSGTAPYTLSYRGLPAGCASQNSTFFSCTPAANGTFVVEMKAVDMKGNTSYANATLTVYPWAIGAFYALDTHFGDPAHLQQPCAIVNASPFFTAYCNQEELTPNLVTFSNGTVGVVSAVTTTASATTCLGAAPKTVSRVHVSLTTTNGVSFGAPIDVGNNSCTYLNAIEPSFAVGGGGIAYGVFVEENSTALPGQYSGRSADALGFTLSTNNGSSWATTRTIVGGGYIARPALATIGGTIYVAYDFIQNSSSTIPGGVYPIAVRVISSTNGGASWSAGTTLPGLNVSQGYNAMSPAIAVAANGTVAVSYATNRTCVDPATSGCYVWGDSLVVSTSSNNGSTWSAPHTVSKALGESTCIMGQCVPAFFQSTPQSSLAFNSSGNLYVGYSATYNQAGAPAAQNFHYLGAYTGLSTNGGRSWTTVAVATALYGAFDNYTNVAIRTHSGHVYVTFSAQNGSLQSKGPYGMSYSQWLVDGITSNTLTLGTPRLISLDPMAPGQTTVATAHSFVGYSSAVGFNASGDPILAFSLPRPTELTTASSATYYYANYTYPTNLTFAFLAERGVGTATDVSVVASGLPTGQRWSFILQGLTFSTNESEIELFNVPTAIPMIFQDQQVTLTGWGVIQTGPPQQSIPEPYTFTGPTTVTVTYHTLFAVSFNFVPTPPPVSGSGSYAELEASMYIFYCTTSCWYGDFFTYWFVDTYSATGTYADNETYQSTSYWYNYYYCYGYINTGRTCFYNNPYNRPYVWYMPAGVSFNPDIYSFGYPQADQISLAVGTGSGSYTGQLNLWGNYPPYDYYYDFPRSITVEGVTNETLYIGAVASSSATFNETVEASGLPGATPYHFTWNGTAYSAVTPARVEVLNQKAGGYAVTDVWANGTTAGWEYFGAVNPAGNVVVPLDPLVNLSFTSYENLSAPTQPIAFHALNITAGTPWSLEFNGTTYTSSTPWINLTQVHPGTYQASALPAVASNGSATYAPRGFGPTISVLTASSVFSVNYGPTFRILVEASTGGTVQLQSGGNPVTSITVWASPGTQKTFTATPSANWVFVGWSGTGPGSYTGTQLNATVTADGAIWETASFQPLPGARFNLSFVQAGLPGGVWWGITLDGIGYSTNQAMLTVPNLYSWGTANHLGQYSLAVPYAYLNSSQQTRFTASGYPSLVGTNGSLTQPVLLQFTAQQLVTVSAGAGGTAQLVVGGIPEGGSWWAAAGTTIQLQEQQAPNHLFVSWTGTGQGSYTGTVPSPSITVGTEPISEYAAFMVKPTPGVKHFTLTITLSTALEAGTVWGISLKSSTTGNVTDYSTLTGAINATGLTLGSYTLTVHSALSADGLTKYTPLQTNQASVTVTANGTVSVGYLASYWVEVESSAGGSAGPASGWVQAGASVSLQAAASPGYAFNGWVGSGSGSYSGANASPTIQSVQAPITEVAEFIPQAPAASTTVAQSIWQNPAVLAGLAAAGIVVGLAIGLLLFRRKGGGPAARPEEPASMEAPAAGGAPAYSEDEPAGGQP